MFSSIRFLARQGLACRSHSDETSITIISYFDCVLLYGPYYRQRVDRSWRWERDVWISHIIYILRQLCDDIRSNGFYSIIVDETTDVSTTEQVHGYVYTSRHVTISKFTMTRSIGKHSTDKTDAATLITTLIKIILIRLQLPPNNMRAQSFDGARNMSRVHTSGVQRRIR